MKTDGLGRALSKSIVDSIRHWIAAIGIVGGLLVAVFMPLRVKLGSPPAISALIVAGLAIVSGIVGGRARGLLGWMLAIVSLVLAVVAVVLGAVSPQR